MPWIPLSAWGIYQRRPRHENTVRGKDFAEEAGIGYQRFYIHAFGMTGVFRIWCATNYLGTVSFWITITGMTGHQRIIRLLGKTIRGRETEAGKGTSSSLQRAWCRACVCMEDPFNLETLSRS